MATQLIDDKQSVAIGIGLQTHVLKTCPVHQQIYFDDEIDPASAFALAIELVRRHRPFVRAFQNDAHELTDLLAEMLGVAPVICPDCQHIIKH